MNAQLLFNETDVVIEFEIKNLSTGIR